MSSTKWHPVSLLAFIRKGIQDEADQLLDDLLPDDPPCWREPKGGCPLRVLDVTRANRRMRAGLPPAHAALEIAVHRAARNHGWTLAVEAIRTKGAQEKAARRGIA